MHNEPALQTPREKPLPTTAASAATATANGTGAIPTPENTNRTPLHEAASTGDEAKVETLLAAGADRNAKESVHGNTPLHEASWKGYSRCVKLLCALPKPAKAGVTSGAKGLELLKDAAAVAPSSSSAKNKHALHDTKGALHSALLGTRNFGGFSALHLAAQNGHNQSCREILLAGGDPDVQNNYGDSPLHTACRYGHAGAIRILLSAKCDFERINLNGDTALHIACAMGRRKLTRILLESGCRQDTKNAQDETARDIAQRKNLVEIINILNAPPPPPAPAPAAPNTVDLSPRRSRERSSSSSHRKATDCPDGHGRSSRPSKPAAGEEGPAHRKSGRRRSNSNDDAKGGGGAGAEVDPKHWSPYGCHYFPDPRNFPSPKLETLPKEPLGNGEQYFLDLAGNIRKGPVGVGNTCYCAPFFKHLEARMNQNRRSIRKYVHRATEKLDSRMTALAMRTDDQIEELTKSMIASRVQCENKRLHLEQWLKRGIAERSTTTTSGGGGGGGGHPLQHTNSKTKKDEANTNTLTRCRSLELLDDHEDLHHPLQAQQSTPVAGAVSTIPAKQLFSSRSIDFLDATGSTVDEEAHLRLLQYGSATGHQSDAFGGSSQHSNMKNHSDAASETPPLPPLARRNRSASICYSSDKDNDREKPPPPQPASQPQPTTSGHREGKSEKAKVTERLEELLSKTKRILELEKLTKAGSPPVATARSDNRYILALDKLRDIHHYDPPLSGTGGAGRGHSPPGAAGYDIAQEMEKITKSLLPATALDAATAPVSPEIAKDITTRKERPTAVYGLALAYGHPQPRGSPVCSASQSGSPFVADEEESHLGRTNFGRDESPGVVVNGFYSNSCFADETLPSSSCNTTIKRNPGTDPEEEEDSPDDGEEQDSDRGDDDGEGDDQRDSESDRADLSAMANLAELKELKSRILNGTNWRSQVLQKSVQDLLLLREGHEDRTRDEPSMGGGDDPTTDTNRVRYIISKLQQSVAGGGHSNPPPPLAQCEDFSDSSEDEDEDEHCHGAAEEDDDDEDCVDGPLPVGRHHSGGGTTTITIPGAAAATTGKIEIGIGTAKSLIQMYEQSSSSSASGPPSKALPTIQGIPKDAYFHDLPRKPTLGDRDEDTPPPMALASRSRNPLPSYLLQEAELFQQQQQPAGSYRATSMLLNGGNEAFLHHPTPPAPSQRHNHHHHHHPAHQSNAYQSYHPVAAQQPPAPESERLLSTRKYINPAATQHQQRSLSSTATPSPEFPLYHQQPQQAQPQHSAVGGAATAVGTVIAGHSHAMMTMMAAAAAAAASRSKSADNLSNDDSGYVSGKVSEIHVPSGGASPLLSLPAGLPNGAAGSNVLIIPPPASASPRHFLPSYPHHHHHHHHHLGLAGNGGGGGGSIVTSIVPPPAPLGSGPPAAPMTSAAAHAAVEQKQQSLYKLGASSLV